MEYLLARSDRQLGICLRMLYDEGYKNLVVESEINAKNRMEFHVKVRADEATMAKLNAAIFELNAAECRVDAVRRAVA